MTSKERLSTDFAYFLKFIPMKLSKVPETMKLLFQFVWFTF